VTDGRPWITACIPTYRCQRYLRHAVESLLSQTFPFIRVVVINDGDPDSPWPVLGGINDPRLFRYDLGENRGPYFCFAVAVEASDDPFFLVQDADDLSAATRVERLLELIRRDRSCFACSSMEQFRSLPNGDTTFEVPLFVRNPSTRPTHDFTRYPVPHHGLFTTHALRRLGGYYGGFKFNYDFLLMKLLVLVGNVSWTPERLYWRRLRCDSLTHAPDTAIGSRARQLIAEEMKPIYASAYANYLRFLARRITGESLLHSIRSSIEARRGATETQRIRIHAARLRQIMRGQIRAHMRTNVRWL